MKALYPKCLKPEHELGHTARGFLLPCCWADRPDLFESDMKNLVQEKFRLSKIKSVEEVLKSNEWSTFYKNLSKGIGCDICYIYCSGKNVKETI